jgi:hypothetical protein
MVPNSTRAAPRRTAHACFLFALPKKYAHPITNDSHAPATFMTIGTCLWIAGMVNLRPTRYPRRYTNPQRQQGTRTYGRRERERNKSPLFQVYACPCTFSSPHRVVSNAVFNQFAFRIPHFPLCICPVTRSAPRAPSVWVRWDDVRRDRPHVLFLHLACGERADGHREEVLEAPAWIVVRSPMSNAPSGTPLPATRDRNAAVKVPDQPVAAHVEEVPRRHPGRRLDVSLVVPSQ